MADERPPGSRPERREVVVEGYVEAADGPIAGWYLRLPLIGLTDQQTRRVREQAQEVLDRFGTSQRATIVHTFQGIVDATEQRLGLRPTRYAAGLPPNIFLVRVAPDETDPWAQIRDDRGTVIAFALRYADDPDPAIASLWRGLSLDFDVLRFHGEV